MIELAPCPICGSKVKVIEIEETELPLHHFEVRCDTCGKQTNRFYGSEVSARVLFLIEGFNGPLKLEDDVRSDSRGYFRVHLPTK